MQIKGPLCIILTQDIIFVSYANAERKTTSENIQMADQVHKRQTVYYDTERYDWFFSRIGRCYNQKSCSFHQKCI